MVLLICTMALYYGLVFYALKKCADKEYFKSISVKEIIIDVLLIASVIVVSYSLNIREKYIYFWDQAVYWQKSLETMEICANSNSLISALSKIVSTINYDDYNLLQGMLIAIPLRILGNQYLSFILVIFVQFLIPSALVIVIILQNIIKKNSQESIKTYYILPIVLFFWWFWLPALNGYADMAAVLMVATCILVTFSTDFMKFSPQKCIMIALSLLFSVLLRRYFAYWVVGYSFGLIFLIAVKLKENKSKITLFNAVKNLIAIYGITGGILLICFNQFLYRSFFNNYAVAYQGYNTTDFFNKFLELFKYMGLFYGLIICFAIFYAFFKRKAIHEIVFLLISALIASALFYKTQNMGIHHYYICSVPLIIILALGILGLSEKKGSFSNVYFGIAFVFYMVYFCSRISILPPFIQEKIAQADNAYYYKPKQRDDLDEIQLLKKKLKDLTPNYEGIYVIGSSTTMTSTILSCSYLPNLKPEINILGDSQVDLRDGFSTSFFDASIIVCATPAQYHMAPESQRVTGILTEEFSNTNSIIKDNFKFIDTIPLEYQVEVQIYAKIKPFSTEEVKYLEELFETYYADFPDLFRLRFERYINDNLSHE